MGESGRIYLIKRCSAPHPTSQRGREGLEMSGHGGGGVGGVRGDLHAALCVYGASPPPVSVLARRRKALLRP